AWREQGHSLYVYSSGSVAAQKLLFAHTTAGDLQPLFTGFFDTSVGGKREAQSYRNVLAALGRGGADVLFLSDVVEELDAAREAGMDTVLVDRIEDYPLPRTGEACNGHHRVESFATIVP
ncbi:MAG: acireductone synthase, partial [Arenimonas sp.]